MLGDGGNMLYADGGRTMLYIEIDDEMRWIETKLKREGAAAAGCRGYACRLGRLRTTEDLTLFIIIWHGQSEGSLLATAGDP